MVLMEIQMRSLDDGTLGSFPDKGKGKTTWTWYIEIKNIWNTT